MNGNFVHKLTELKNSVQDLLINLDPQVKLGIIGFIVGVTSGLAAVALTYALKNIAVITQRYQHQFINFLLPIIGIFITVIFLKYLVRDFGGHGLPEVIHSISLKGGKIKLRSSISRLIGSLITISSKNAVYNRFMLSNRS